MADEAPVMTFLDLGIGAEGHEHEPGEGDAHRDEDEWDVDPAH